MTMRTSTISCSKPPQRVCILTHTLVTHDERIDIHHSTGIKVMADLVVNHVGYIDMQQTSGVNPFYNDSNFHNCPQLQAAGLCDACQLPSNLNLSVGPERYLAESTSCRLSGLPDLNHTQPAVREALVGWVQWYMQTYAFHGARFDAVGHIPPVGAMNTLVNIVYIRFTYSHLQDLYPLLSNATMGYTLAEVFVPTVAELELWYAPVRALGQKAMQNMGFLNFPMAIAMRSVFAWEAVGNVYAGNHSCRCACKCLLWLHTSNILSIAGCSSKLTMMSLLPACTCPPWACLLTTTT